jgi:AGCS family alanine or glycine:cation symporter
MAIPNLVALLLLSGVAAQETKKYLWANRLDEEMEETNETQTGDGEY